jgi:hypothetical protein
MFKPERTRHYNSPLYDSARWDKLALRPGDIIVATPYKAGTTWTQYLCAMAIHGGPALPMRLSDMSPWLDTKLVPLDEAIAALEAQPWRRIIKTHTPLDGIPYREDVSYVVCGRDARDGFLSMRDHGRNFSAEKRGEMLRAAGLPETLPFPTETDALFRLWMTIPAHPWTHDGLPFGPYFHHLLSYWDARALPNVFMWHYRDLARDLPTEFDRLAAFLGVTLSAEQRAAILGSAQFDTMRNDAANLAPMASQGMWVSDRDFFRDARVDAWREGLNAESQALYDKLTRERYPAEFLRWLENGRG